MTQDKDVLRVEARRVRARAHGESATAGADAACDLFFDALAPGAGQVVAGYCPAGTEIDALTVLERHAGPTALPVMETGTRVLRFAPWRWGEALSPGPHGILAPESSDSVRPDIVLVPLLAFDRRGGRLGQGGGYYDATLATLREAGAPVTAVGLAYGEQACLFPLPRAAHDQALDWVITPRAARRF